MMIVFQLGLFKDLEKKHRINEEAQQFQIKTSIGIGKPFGR